MLTESAVCALTVESFVDRANEITRLLKEFRNGCRFNAHDGYVPKDEAKAASCIAGEVPKFT